MSTEARDLEVRSEEVQELLGTPPHWLVRWGMLFIFVLLILTIWLLYWITFPETVKANIRIKREDPGVELFTNKSVHISHVLVASEDTVEAGQTLLVFQSDVQYAEVHALDDYINRLEKGNDSLLVHYQMAKDLILGGPLEEARYTFIEKQAEVRNMQTGRLSLMSIEDIRREIRQEQNNIVDERRRKESLQSEQELFTEAFIRKQNLYQSGRGDFNEVRTAEAVKQKYDRYVQEAETSIKTRQANIRQLTRQLETMATISEASKAVALEQLRDELEALKRAVDAWRSEYLLVTPINGVVILESKIRVGEYVQDKDRLAVVLPDSPSNLIGKAELDLNQSGQVALGQKVIVDFYSFPAQQYGAVEGEVTFKSKIPTRGDKLPIEIRFPQGLVTNTGRSLEVGEEMAGKMTIVIEEKRLILWLLQRF
ncbi:MAG: hypothetical protein DA408_05985 [Bacteroidetes bacterium]|nr:MAG: hypothetical protein C7N36_15785 [Bacteroidota bacterium]PTM13681.1 MAG: hypothetical protein DA408_05985 [Bacteroidota bacterium]